MPTLILADFVALSSSKLFSNKNRSPYKLNSRQLRQRQDLIELEKCGGICDCQSSRVAFVYAAPADSRGLNAVTRVLAEVTLRPKITNEEVSIARQTVKFELESLLMRPEQEPLLMDMIQAAAYKNNTLGLPKICPAENTSIIDRSILLTYLKHHYTPKRMVVAGVGVDHDKSLECINKYFVQEQPIWADDVTEIAWNYTPIQTTYC